MYRERGTPRARPALRSPAFRWFFAGLSISTAGSLMAPVALAFGILEITDSAAWLSAVTTAAVVPMVATMLLGGGIADRYRRDTVLRRTSLGRIGRYEAGDMKARVAFDTDGKVAGLFFLPPEAA